MAKRVNVGVYIGRQDLLGGNYADLYNLVIPVRNAALHLTHPIDSTVSHQTLTRLVPGLVLPPHPQKGDMAYALN